MVGHWLPAIREHKTDVLLALREAADARACESWPPHGLADAVHAMAGRWHYSAAELEWALELAKQHPAEWLALIEADLQGRRWPGGEGCLK